MGFGHMFWKLEKVIGCWDKPTWRERWLVKFGIRAGFKLGGGDRVVLRGKWIG